MRAINAFISSEFIIYLTNFINEELNRKKPITRGTIINALEAFENGAEDESET